MEKPLEERLTNIESAIPRFSKMQSCLFYLLLALDSRLQASAAHKESKDLARIISEFARLNAERANVSMFGAVGLIALAVSLGSLYLANQGFGFLVAAIAAYGIGLGIFVHAIVRDFRERRQLQKLQESFTEVKQLLEETKETDVKIDETEEVIKALWERLNPVPDDLATESTNGKSDHEDSHNKS